MMSDGNLFRSDQQFAAWLWPTPKAHSSGGQDRQVDISKQGEGYLRRLLVVGATAVMRLARQDHAACCWAAKLLERKPAKLATISLINKTASIGWAVFRRGGTCQGSLCPANPRSYGNAGQSLCNQRLLEK